MNEGLPRPGLSRALRETGVVAIVRGRDGARLREVADTLVGAGVRSLEITLNTPGALAVVRALAAHVETGVGTVRDPDQVDSAAEAGARYVVSPHASAAIAARARAAGLWYLPGAFTATEVVTAWDLGVAAVKLFPAGLGGPRYLRDLLAPLDDVRLLPTGGVTDETAHAFFDAGAVAVGAGGWLLGDSLEGGSLAALADRTRRLLDAATQAMTRQGGAVP